VDPGSLPASERQRIIDLLSRVRGVVRVDVRPVATDTTTGDTPRPRAETSTVAETLRTGQLPGGQLFRPLIADPRWPHFAAAYHHYVNEGDLRDVGTVSFGETFTLYRDTIGTGWWEAGLQAGVFAVFDLAAESVDLINADYMAAALLGYRRGALSALGRLFHQSSHIGDEFLIGNRVRNRINVSYEGLDAKVSYEFGRHDFGSVFRLYTGGGFLFGQEPATLDPWSVQGGAEFRSPWLSPAGFRPIAGLDVQSREENEWDVDISVRAGVQIDGVLATRSFQLLLEYFDGHSPNGQFYKDRINYFGIGAHFHF
jgi:hypothetical protein